ncbi:hypothetical protein AYL99_08906 [Fonsecaea erecta]|uniref:Uncharacterized protein n=1 Tax=Fonsecaea erecta TaxID=1367422 RepID=A0A178ZAI7_9EURO|nr:hypothetical protein AYL99_08906 [Fonsecaea erecta]OAP56794.1 hypothetical protein AYL99_08906 [Fonsecaea erecta]
MAFQLSRILNGPTPSRPSTASETIQFPAPYAQGKCQYQERNCNTALIVGSRDQASQAGPLEDESAREAADSAESQGLPRLKIKLVTTVTKCGLIEIMWEVETLLFSTKPASSYCSAGSSARLISFSNTRCACSVGNSNNQASRIVTRTANLLKPGTFVYKHHTQRVSYFFF